MIVSTSDCSALKVSTAVILPRFCDAKKIIEAQNLFFDGLSEEKRRQFENYVLETVSQSGKILEDILQKSPFNSSTPEYKNLKISIMLTSIQILKNKKKLATDAQQSIIIWHLPKSMSSYAKILLKEFFTALKQEIIECYKMADLSETELDSILTAAAEEVYYKNEDQQH